jgi:hypothetical protein
MSPRVTFIRDSEKQKKDGGGREKKKKKKEGGSFDWGVLNFPFWDSGSGGILPHVERFGLVNTMFF